MLGHRQAFRYITRCILGDEEAACCCMNLANKSAGLCNGRWQGFADPWCCQVQAENVQQAEALVKLAERLEQQSGSLERMQELLDAQQGTYCCPSTDVDQALGDGTEDTRHSVVDMWARVCSSLRNAKTEVMFFQMLECQQLHGASGC